MIKPESFFDELLADLNKQSLYSKTGRAYTSKDFENQREYARKLNIAKEANVKLIRHQEKMQRLYEAGM
jgi:hypothetical protein